MNDWLTILVPGVAFSCATLCLFTGLWLRSVPRSERFRALHYLRWTAAAGGLFAALSIPETFAPSDALATGLARIQIVAASVALFGLLRYVESLLEPQPTWVSRGLRVMILVGALVCVLPGVGFTGRGHAVTLPSLGIVSVTAEQTIFGQLGVTLLSAPLAVLTVLLFLARRRGNGPRLANFFALLAVGAAGIADAATTAGFLAAPLLLPAGLTACLLLLAGEFSHQFREDTEALDRLTADLSGKVEERSRALAVTAQKLLRTEKLALVGRLSGGVAHEINNPVSALTANIEYLRAALAKGALPADAAECLEESAVAARRVGETARQLLLASRAAAAEVDGESYALDPLLARSLADSERRAGRGGWVKCELVPGLHAAGRGQLVERLLIELLAAAAGTATESRPLHLSLLAEADTVRITLRLEGAWLPAFAPGKDGLFVGRDQAGDVHPLVVALNLLLLVGGRAAIHDQGERVELSLTRATAPESAAQTAGAPVGSP